MSHSSSADAVPPVDRDAATYVAGHRGLVGSAVWRRLQDDGFTRLVGRSSDELDLRVRSDVFDFVSTEKPQLVIIAAAKVGGILGNSTYPADFLSENLQIQVNLMDAAVAARVPRLLFLGSSCIYPRDAAQPIKEEYLLTGHLEQTNDAYGLAKKAHLVHAQVNAAQYGQRFAYLIPTNLYGPGDNFSARGSHVLPGLIRRYSEASDRGDTTVTNWGSGTPRREFLHVDDMADACLHLLRTYDGPEQVNVGTGEDVTIRELAAMVSDAVGYRGETEWDTGKPDGTPRKLLDVSKLRSSGWEPRIDLGRGLVDTVAWFRAHRDQLRDVNG